MARFHYLQVTPLVKRVLITFGLDNSSGDGIPCDQGGTFTIPVQEVSAPTAPAQKTQGTGKLVFGGKHNPDQRAARFWLDKLLELGFLPNNIYLVANAKQAGKYQLRVWLDCDPENLGRKSFADFGDAGDFALRLLSAIWSTSRAYDNGDSLSVGMEGVVLEERPSTRFHVLVPAAPKASVATKPVAQKSKVDTKPVAPAKPKVQKPAVVLATPEPTSVMGLAFSKMLGKTTAPN